MLFDSPNDIKNDILNKISNHLILCHKENTIVDKKNILSLLRTYFYELKIRDLLNDYKIEISDNGVIMIMFIYNNLNYDLNIDLFDHVRKLKINKISNILENFII